MHTEISPNASLPVLNEQRANIEAAMARYLAGPDDDGDAASSAAHQLFEVLLDALEGSPTTLKRVDPGLRRYASSFGDGLTPVLRDVVGADASDAFIASCVDRYWEQLRPLAA